MLKQGEKAWKITVDSKEFEMLSPIEGKVVAVNPLLASSAQALKNDPYGKGWMLKIESPSLSSEPEEPVQGRSGQEVDGEGPRGPEREIEPGPGAGAGGRRRRRSTAWPRRWTARTGT